MAWHLTLSRFSSDTWILDKSFQCPQEANMCPPESEDGNSHHSYTKWQQQSLKAHSNFLLLTWRVSQKHMTSTTTVIACLLQRSKVYAITLDLLTLQIWCSGQVVKSTGESLGPALMSAVKTCILYSPIGSTEESTAQHYCHCKKSILRTSEQDGFIRGLQIRMTLMHKVSNDPQLKYPQRAISVAWHTWFDSECTRVWGSNPSDICSSKPPLLTNGLGPKMSS